MAIALDRLLADECAAVTRHKVCRSRGGESCAFDGAAIVLVPIADAAHVVHGPLSCCGISWQGRGVHSTVGGLHLRGFSTDLTELDIVYGCEERLMATVREVAERERPSAVFVYATCVTGLVGEDIAAACTRLSDELKIPVIPVDSPGFVGPKNLGNRIAGDVLLEHVIGTAEAPETSPTDIALIGEYNVAGDLAYVEPLLAECGIRILSHITGNARFEEIRWAHRARLSALVCSRALVNVAAGLERRWGIPSVEVSFYGATETARSLRRIAAALEDAVPEAAGVRQRVEAVIARRETELTEALAPYVDVIGGQRAVLYSGGVKSWSMASALRDLGVEVVAVGTKKSTAEDEAKVREVLGDGVPLLEDTSPKVLRSLFDDGRADVLVAGGRNRYLAAKEGWPFIDVNQEREHAYAGYEGLVNIARDLAASVRYHDRERRGASIATQTPHAAPVRAQTRAGAIDPIATAPSLGAVLALQGVDRALPVLHSAQGCAFLEKVLAIRHHDEPIALATSRLFTEDVVMGGDDAALRVVRGIAHTAPPDLVALVGGALASVRGDDLEALASSLRREFGTTVIAIHTPDYEGSLERGHAAAIEALLSLADAPAEKGIDPRQVTVLAPAFLTAADARWLRRAIESFGLVPVLVPDAGALDGSRRGLSPLTAGGTTLDELRTIGRSAHTLAIGPSLEPAARQLAERFSTPSTVLDCLHGLAATDLLTSTLTRLSGGPATPDLERERRVLVDAMRDVHLELSGARVTLALEPDHAHSLCALFAEVASDVTCVVPSSPPDRQWSHASSVVVGDLASVADDCELVAGSSRARLSAERLGAAHLPCGFPITERYGASRELTIGYEGATRVIDQAATLLATRYRARHETTTTERS